MVGRAAVCSLMLMFARAQNHVHDFNQTECFVLESNKSSFRVGDLYLLTGHIAGDGGMVTARCSNDTEAHKCSHSIQFGAAWAEYDNVYFRNVSTTIGDKGYLGVAQLWRSGLVALSYYGGAIDLTMPALAQLATQDCVYDFNQTESYVGDSTLSAFRVGDFYHLTGHIANNGGMVAAHCSNDTEAHKCSLNIQFGYTICYGGPNWYQPISTTIGDKTYLGRATFISGSFALQFCDATWTVCAYFRMGAPDLPESRPVQSSKSLQTNGLPDCSVSKCPSKCQCGNAHCSQQVEDCMADASCAAAQTCVAQCACSDEKCGLACFAQHPSAKSLPLGICSEQNCATSIVV